MPHLHIIGICGTAMAGLAALAQESDWRVTGSDSGVYPPMSTFLEERGIAASQGYRPENLEPAPDLTLVGNAISRGNPELEALLDRNLPYCSGAEWLGRHVLEKRHPIVVAGTHGKTTTSSLIAWLWECAGLKPGFLIGGIPGNFGQGARFPQSQWVVVEGDEYDTAFFDKRSKFLHYRPRTLILNNLEYDHADIFPDLESIRVQFRLLLRTVPASGLVVANGDDPEVEGLLAKAYGRVVRFGLSGNHPYSAQAEQPDASTWTLLQDGTPLFTVTWGLVGRHNLANGLAAAVTALCHNLPAVTVKKGLESFQGVARRLQHRFTAGGVAVYDDFAHHPTAIAATLEGFKAATKGKGKLWIVLEPRSNTMRRRIHQERLAGPLGLADYVVLARPAARGLKSEELLDVDEIAQQINRQSRQERAVVVDDASEAVDYLVENLVPGDQVVIMSNGGFDGIHDRLQQRLAGG